MRRPRRPRRWLRDDDGRYRAIRLRRLIVTWCVQGAAAPPIDRAWTTDLEGHRYGSLAILLRPWRRTSHGERERGPALVVGWRE